MRGGPAEGRLPGQKGGHRPWRTSQRLDPGPRWPVFAQQPWSSGGSARAASALGEFRRLKAHWQGILNAFDSRLSNGSVEGMNAQIQAAKARARGFRTTRNLITVCYLIGGKLTHLPASPYGTTCRPAAA